ncbi:cytochrome P450 [Amycolatopsis sp. YIM 10]|uniref:cytochrome P450 n=1 Tax=Amycolatopsis sp. YIM 10 TaxID=2653857 RepID=UPI00128FF088|nr:cytochrome P450 [Amycolatopsis sp. YIM 10]QFU89905.1 Biotin biosynthesis cytochrome P450 [Amycolatopsis sp. YIM 10]
MTGTTLHEVFTDALGFDPASPGFRDNPYQHYARLRERNPVHRGSAGFWVVSGYDRCVEVLADQRFGHPQGRPVHTPDALLGGSADQDNFLLFMNPPQHTRVRAAVRRVFGPAFVNRLRPYVEREIERLLDAAFAAPEFDVIGSLAHPLSLATVCELLGVPDGDRPMVMAAAQDFLAGIDPTFALTDERGARRDAALATLDEYFGNLLARKRDDPAEDLLSALATLDDLDPRELRGTGILMFIAGHGTTTNLIGNGTLALIRHPAEREQFLAEPGIAVTALEELLRFDAPSQLTVRTALEDVALGEHHIAEGEQVLVLRGAANHDPARFADPGRLELTRPDNKHLAFGSGIHRCLGAPLARMEGGLALRALFTRAPDLAVLPGQLSYRDSLLIRGLTALPVTARR